MNRTILLEEERNRSEGERKHKFLKIGASIHQQQRRTSTSTCLATPDIHMGRYTNMSPETPSSPRSRYKAPSNPHIPCRYYRSTQASAIPSSTPLETHMDQQRQPRHTTTSSSATSAISNSTTSPSSTILATTPPARRSNRSAPSSAYRRPLEEPSYPNSVNDKARIQREDALYGEGGGITLLDGTPMSGQMGQARPRTEP